MKGKRGLGGKRCVRKSVQITRFDEQKLNRLSISTGLPPATIISIFLEQCLNSVQHIQWLQDEYCKRDDFRAYPIVEGDKIILN